MLPEERMGRLETNVEHIQSDISQIRVDLRDLRQDLNRVGESVNSLKVGRMADRVGMLLIGGAILSVMARAFGWI